MKPRSSLHGGEDKDTAENLTRSKYSYGGKKKCILRRIRTKCS